MTIFEVLGDKDIQNMDFDYVEAPDERTYDDWLGRKKHDCIGNGYYASNIGPGD
jgi:hypothetical protein